MKILITGASGLVGSHYTKNSKHELATPDEKELDITDAKKVAKFIAKTKPNAVINFAAYTDVKKAELQRKDRNGTAWKINVTGAKNLAKTCAESNIHFIQISTDLIFSGKDSSAKTYTEASPYDTNLKKISWYGITKMEGEKSIKECGGKWTIVRIAYPFSGPAGPKTDLLHNIISLYDSKNLYPMFTDNSITPTYIPELIKALDTVVEKKALGVFHVVSEGVASHYSFAEYSLSKSSRDSNKLQTTLLAEFAKSSPIPRPLHIKLDTESTKKKLGIKFGTWQQNVSKALKDLSF